MHRPRIGITTSLNEGEQRLDARYIQAVERAGGLPVIVPMLTDPLLAETVAESLDGLIVTGGPAVEDGLIGVLPDDIHPTDRTRTESDSRILDHLLRKSRPVLGICYGMQLANALRGGRIFADVQAQLAGALVHSDKRGADLHPIRLSPNSVLHRIFGSSDLEVNTRHIQAIQKPAEEFLISATAPDGVIEAIESRDGSFVGVQFHPERMGDVGDDLFSYIVARASKG